MKYNIGIHGCDDSTYVEMELNEVEFRAISELARQSVQNSTYGCMPTIHIESMEVDG